MQKHVFDFLRYLKTEKNVSPHTERSYLSDLEQLFDFLGDTDLAKADHQVLRQFLAHLVKLKARKSSIARKLSAIRTFFRYLNREGILSNNPARLVATPKQDKRLPAVLTVDDAVRLMDAPKGNNKTELRDRAILETLYSTGIRASELVGMNQEDINKPDRLVRIRGKGRKERIVPIGVKALAVLNTYMADRAGGSITPAVFTNPSGKRLTARTVQRILANYRKQLGLAQKAGPHTLRHSCAQRLVDAEFSLKVIGDYLGHRRASSTRIYAKVGLEALRDVALGDGEGLHRVDLDEPADDRDPAIRRSQTGPRTPL